MGFKWERASLSNGIPNLIFMLVMACALLW